MTDIYTTPIRTEADAEGFFFQLHQLGRLFHPEDDPSEVVNGASGEWLFTKEQAQHLRDRINEVYEVMDDPCDYCLTLTHPDSDRDDDHGLSHTDRAQFYGPSVRI
jgi:hypothetical protein